MLFKRTALHIPKEIYASIKKPTITETIRFIYLFIYLFQSNQPYMWLRICRKYNLDQTLKISTPYNVSQKQ